MTRYYAAWLTFMIVLVIAGLMFEGFDSQQGVVVTVIVALSAAFVGYVLTPKINKGEE
ncbi:hypothetical protein KRX51_06970 [Corynebacterium sp. TAE3-ERU12]|uniref:hypothetical protein n=1 Tax=Corynebacterium sp. TAE3-ERU12 TaxID=2849491 RepID=UPI001C485B6D|nr:hypothetical protein [Corynebacterium sp. TAE3-ERU12]MBV7295656.1 hypothetical protein [Corynebacterium sp. TAE3-ERU12]